MRDVLESLAARYGIEPGYTDVAGVWHPTSSDTRRVLLRAMGVEASTAAAARSALAHVEAAEQATPLVPTVIIADTGAGADIRVAAADGTALSHVLTLETGETRTGTADARGGSVRLRGALPPGRHHLQVEAGGRRDEAVLIAAPRRCLTPDQVFGRTAWGAACQVYGLRSARNAGIGDFEDVSRLAETLGGAGADLLGLSPLHALFPADPHQFSPYAPSSRIHLNTLHITLDEAAALAGAPPPDDATAAELRATELVDYERVAAFKGAVLERLWPVFRDRHLGQAPTERGRDFLAWRSERGPSLERLCLFDALHAHDRDTSGELRPWWRWAVGAAGPDAADARAFAAEHADRIAAFAWMQWVADRQLGAAQARARAGGMRGGLYRDLAIGVSPAGAAVWSDPAATVRGASVGAPPDLFNTRGQNWGLAPLSPAAMIERAYAPFIADVGANMRHAGALRIDHALGLQRLFWIPDGAAPSEGAYVRYPFDALRRILALESQRRRCLVIGEDLGTVPDGFRVAMNRSGILSYRVLWFERSDGGGFAPPGRYPRLAAASLTTHDLPTVRGYWDEQDIHWREGLGLFAAADMAPAERLQRADDRLRMIELLVREGLIDPEALHDVPRLHDGVVTALHRLLARSRSALALAQLEDVTGELEQPNLPATVHEHPNWRRKLRLSVEDLPLDARAQEVLQAIAAERPRPRRALRA